MGAKPRLPPFWALGWMQGSKGWTEQLMVEEVVNKYAIHNMPLDTILLDIPYMDEKLDFTVDLKKFPDLPDFINRLHQN